MSAKPTDAEVVACLVGTGGRMTFSAKNVLRRKYPDLETPWVLRRMKALEKAGHVVRVPCAYIREICWDVAPLAANPREPK